MPVSPARGRVHTGKIKRGRPGDVFPLHTQRDVISVGSKVSHELGSGLTGPPITPWRERRASITSALSNLPNLNMHVMGLKGPSCCEATVIFTNPKFHLFNMILKYKQKYDEAVFLVKESIRFLKTIGDKET